MIGKIGGAAAGIALLTVGCATHDRDYDRGTSYYSGAEQRTYVRSGDEGLDRRYDDYSEHPNQPRYRGKHPDTMGWNDPEWYGR